MPEHARVEAGERDDPLAGESEHEQAGRAKHVARGVSGVDGERGLAVGFGLDDPAAARACGEERAEAGDIRFGFSATAAREALPSPGHTTGSGLHVR